MLRLTIRLLVSISHKSRHLFQNFMENFKKEKTLREKMHLVETNYTAFFSLLGEFEISFSNMMVVANDLDW